MDVKVLGRGWTTGEKASVTDLTGVKGDIKRVRLPYDAAIHQKRDPKMDNGYQKGYFPDKAWQYTYQFDAPEEWKDKTIYIEFEGVFRDAEVLLNKNAVTRQHCGYLGFTECLDAFLKYGQKNTLTVTAKSGREQHWYSGTGIFRPVNLYVANLIHIAPSGVKITPVDVEEHSAVVEVETRIINKTRQTRELTLTTDVIDSDDRGYGSESVRVTVLADSETTARQRIYVSDITRWSTDHPVLYTCKSTLSEQDEVQDTARNRFGIRSISLDPVHGFRLNGEEIKLRGGCIHHDAGVIGAATFKDAEKRRIHKLKEAGFNAIRAAHNPSSRALLEACDEEGMLVMEETFSVWNVIRFIDDYSAYFDREWEKDYAAVVKNAYNHPSVILYSIGNEIQEIITDAGKSLCHRIAARMHSYDPTRYTTMAINGMVCIFDKMDEISPQTSEQGGDINQAMVDVGDIMSKIMMTDIVGDGISECADAVDVAGYNYMQARYEIDSRLHPNRVIVGSETHPREIDKLWGLVRRHKNVIGDFTWTAWNYLGEAGIGRNNYGTPQDLTTSYLGEFPWIGSDCGDFDLTGVRHPISYYREIVYGLRTDPYIAVRDPKHYGETIQRSPWGWTDSLSSWSWTGFEGHKVQVEVYADADEVVLYQDDTEIGRAACHEEERYQALFETVFQPGELKAVAFADGREIGSYTLRSASGDPVLRITPEKKESTDSPESLIYVDIAVTDQEGIIFNCINPKVTLSVEGAAELLGMGNGSPITDERYDDNEQTMYEGRLLAVLRPKGQGSVVVTANADGFEAASAEIIVKE